MEAIKGIYHPDKIDTKTFIENFTIRLKEFDNIIGVLTKQKKKPLQHFLITGKRGMGKSTLLKRIYLEARNEPLNKKLIGVRLGSEHYNLSKLYKLWEEVIKHLSVQEPLLEVQKKKLANEKNYEEHIVQIIIDYLNTQNKTLLLLIDNFDQFIGKLSAKEQHAFREILMQYPIQIIGNSVFYTEHFFSYNEPFYDFFKRIHLNNLDKKEAEAFILQLAKNEGIEDFEAVLESQKGKIQTLRILSGGVPRTLVIILSILSKKNTGDAIDYLHEMLEQVTPLYQDRMKSFSAQQQEIMHYLAINWDRTPVKELAKEMREPSKNISAQLAQLEKSGYINKFSTGNRNLLYEIDERFFNIWLLMSEASAYDAKRVIWLTRWLDIFYDSGELEEYAFHCNNSLRKSKPVNRFMVVQALSESGKLSMAIKNKIIDETTKDLSDELPEIKDWAKAYENKKSNEINTLHENIQIAINKKDYDLALNKLLLLREVDPANCFSGMGLVYFMKEDYTNAEKYYLMAVDYGHVKAIYNLGVLYDEIMKDYVNAEKYYLLAAKSGDVRAMYNLGILYRYERKDYANAEKYYLMAIEHGDIDAMYNLGSFYDEEKQDYANAEKYYLMAIEHGNVRAMCNLGYLYDEETQDYANAEKYYLMAVEHGDVKSMFNLGYLYDEVRHDHINAEKYYLMAVEHGNASAANNLALIYYENNDTSQKERAMELISSIKEIDITPHHIVTKIQLLLWNKRINEAQIVTENLLGKSLLDDSLTPFVSQTFIYFLIFKQKEFLYSMFGNNSSSLKDRLRPIYFALMHEMKAELPNEYLKMPEEMEEPINDLLAFIKREQELLGIS